MSVFHPTNCKINLDSKTDLLRMLYNYKKLADMHFACSITDTDGSILYVNRKFCEISGFSEDELLGKNHRVVNSGYHPRSFFSEMWSTIKSGQIWHGEVKSKGKNGSYFWLHSTILPVYDTKGNIVQFFSLRFPIDDKKKAEEDKNMRIMELDSMLFMTSHKVRQPVANILGIAEQIEKNIYSRDELLKVTGYLKQSAILLDNFTRELTAYIQHQKDTTRCD